MKSLSRREFLRFSSFTAASMLATSPLKAIAKLNKGKKKYNILCIVIDDLRIGLGCYGQKQIHSPNIDKLASEGLLFENAYTQQAVCTPSRVSFLTGCRPDTTGLHFYYTKPFFDDYLPNHVTFSRHLMNNGYYSLAYGKLFHGGGEYLSERFRFPRKPLWVLPENQGDALRPSIEISDLPDEEYMDGDDTRQLIDDLKKAKDRDKPFCFSIGYYKPHVPLTMPRKYWDMYKPEDIKLPENSDYPKNISKYTIPGTFKKLPDGKYQLTGGSWLWARNYIKPENGVISEKYAKKLIHAYYACTSFADAQVGKVLKTLDELDMANDTIVLLWSDHGIHYGEHGWWDKFTNFDLDTQIPMIIKIPGKTSGQKTKAFVESVDIYPTLCDLAGAPKPDYLEGTSFVPVIENPKRDWKTAAFSQYSRYAGTYGGDKKNFLKGYTIRTKDWRYVELWELARNKILGQGKLWSNELYDQKKDPDEMVNVADKPEHQKIVAELAKHLHTGYKGELPRGVTNKANNPVGQWGQNVYTDNTWLRNEFASIHKKAKPPAGSKY